ncbi:MAG: hypothetical protein KC502_07310 [Myxococcales bacterium]|nr:hypothetical protein [Myxococcales bacterium]
MKLQSGARVNQIKPIVFEMDGAEPRVPLRLISIAATDNMSVVVTLVWMIQAGLLDWLVSP